MAEKDKATLRADIASMLPNNTTGLINPTVDRTLREDFVDSLLASESVQPGAGISVDRASGVLTISTGGAQASVGLPIFFGAATYSAANSRITLTGVVAPPRPSIIYCIAPVDLDRAADDLTMLVDGVEYDLVDVVAGNVAARLLTPAALVGVLWRSGEARQLEVLEPRPQDYAIAVVLGEDANDVVLAASDLGTARAAFSAPTDNVMDLTAAIAAAGLTSSATRTVWIGVPVDAPDVAGFTSRGSEESARLVDTASLLTDIGTADRYTDVEPSYNGVQYKWWEKRRRTSPTSEWYGFVHRGYD